MARLTESADIRSQFTERLSIAQLSAVIALILAIAVLDLGVQRILAAVLYAIPLILTAWAGQRRWLQRLAILVIGLTAGLFVIKYWLVFPPAEGLPMFPTFRILNRSLVAGMLWLLYRVLEIWLDSEEERRDPALPDEFVHQDDEINRSIAILVCVPMLVVIAVIDFFSPGNINIPVLYILPLFVCAWVRNIGLTWVVFAASSCLSIAAVFVYPPHEFGSVIDRPFSVALWNRLLVVATMFVLASVLQHWMHTRQRQERARLDRHNADKMPDLQQTIER